MSTEQLKHYLEPFINIVELFTHGPTESRWANKLYAAFNDNVVIVDDLIGLGNLQWKDSWVPQEAEAKFAF